MDIPINAEVFCADGSCGRSITIIGKSARRITGPTCNETLA